MDQPAPHLCTNDGCGEAMFKSVGYYLCQTCDMAVNPAPEEFSQ